MSNLKEILDKAASRQSAEPPSQWPRATIDEFLEWLRGHYPSLRAWCAPSAAPNVVRLMLSPASRLNEASTLLVAELLPNRVRVLGQDARSFETAEELYAFLAALLTSHNFEELLRVLKSRETESVEGFLRAGAARDRHPRHDVFVEVSAETQQKIASASGKNEAIVIEVKRMGPTPFARGELEARPKPDYLVSGGFAVKLQGSPAVDGENIRLEGRVAPLSEA